MRKFMGAAMLLSMLSINCLESTAQDTMSMYKIWDDFLARIKNERSPSCWNKCGLWTYDSTCRRSP